MAFRDQGFLDETIDGWMQKIYDDNKDIFDVCFGINELLMEVQLELKDAVTDVRQLLIACLFIRATSSYQAALLLLRRGMLKDGGILIRVLMDTVFRMKAIEVDAGVVTKYIKEDDVIRMKLMNKYASLSNDAKDEHKTRHLAGLLKALKRTIEDEGSEGLKSEWFAQKAGLRDDYNSMYSLLSNDVHATVKSIDDLVDRDADDNILGFKVGPGDAKRPLMLVLALAGKYGILSVGSCFKILKLSEHEKLKDVPEKLKALRERLHSFEERLLLNSP